jgi:Leucine-rich repeat (LRR) protein
MDCKNDLPPNLPENQKEWYCRFQKLFAEKSEDHIAFLKSCNSFDEKDWQSNFKHVVNRPIMGDCKSYFGVEQQIIENERKKNESLSLYSLILTRIPTIISSLKHLTRLSIVDMDIHIIPKEISKLSNLKHFIVSKCPIYDMPEWISDLGKLCNFTFSRCRLRKISSTLQDCQKLIVINLQFNWISKFENLDFPNLQRLNLEANPTSIDWGSVSMPKLAVLNISQTKIYDIDDRVSNNLIVLSWSGVEKIKIPKLSPKLKYLNLVSSSFDRFPSEVFEFENLEYINLSTKEKLSKKQKESLEERNVKYILCKK